MYHITEIRFEGKHLVYAPIKYKYNYGQVLKFVDLDLPTAYEVDVSSSPNGSSVTMIGNSDGVLIPSQFFANQMIYVYLFLHDEETDGQTVYEIRIPVTERPTRTNEEPDPEQESTIGQLITELNNAVDATAQSAQNAAISERNAATSERNAAASETNAATSERNAGQSAEAAAGSEAVAIEKARQAAQSASDALGYKNAAETAANNAEQASANAGYMFFYIDEHGDLIYQRTPNTEVDFYLSNGDLYVRANE